MGVYKNPLITSTSYMPAIEHFAALLIASVKYVNIAAHRNNRETRSIVRRKLLRHQLWHASDQVSHTSPAFIIRVDNIMTVKFGCVSLA